MNRPPRTIRHALGCSLCACLATQPAWAGGPLGKNGDPIQTSRYGIDLYQGAVWAGSRMTSLGGSYVAVAYDVDGMLQNPAAPAVRPFFSVTHFDYWLGFGLTVPSNLSDLDFFNSGGKTGINDSPDGLIYLTPAAILQFGTLGVGINVEYQQYALGDATAADGTQLRLSTSFTMTHVQVANAFFEGALVIGGGLRLLDNRVVASVDDSEVTPLVASGVGTEIGVLWKPHGERFRLGAAYRSAISARSAYSEGATLNEDNDVVLEADAGDIYLPETANLPWDLNLGFAYDLGETQPNAPWRSNATLVEKEELRLRLRLLNSRDERDRKLARATSDIERDAIEAHHEAEEEQVDRAIAKAREDAYWRLQQEMAVQSRRVAMVSASLLISGAVGNSVGVESFIGQEVNRSGQWMVVSPRLGSEVEVIPDFVKLRAGVYLEPTRFETSTKRAHHTGGIDVPLGVWNVFSLWPDDYRWRASMAFDVAREFSTVSFTLGGWYPRHRERANRERSF